MPKIAMIGAGSVIFTKTLMNDIMGTPALQASEFALMDTAEGRLRKMEAFAKDVVRENNLPTKVGATTDRRKALEGGHGPPQPAADPEPAERGTSIGRRY